MPTVTKEFSNLSAAVEFMVSDECPGEARCYTTSVYSIEDSFIVYYDLNPKPLPYANS